MVQVKPTFRDFSGKIQKKGCYALLTYFPKKKFKSEKNELSSKRSAFARAKRSKPKLNFKL